MRREVKGSSGILEKVIPRIPLRRGHVTPEDARAVGFPVNATLLTLMSPACSLPAKTLDEAGRHAFTGHDDGKRGGEWDSTTALPDRRMAI